VPLDVETRHLPVRPGMLWRCGCAMIVSEPVATIDAILARGMVAAPSDATRRPRTARAASSSLMALPKTIFGRACSKWCLSLPLETQGPPRCGSWC
jgi:hypothetical protein